MLRSYSPADDRSTRHVFESAIHGTASRFYSQEQIDAWCPPRYDEQAWGRARAEAWTVVAELDGQVVGFSDLRADGELDMLFVSPTAGDRGIARALVTAVLAQARERGLTTVTTRASRSARPVFERLGFVVDRENSDNVIRGVAVPNFSMHCDLQ